MIYNVHTDKYLNFSKFTYFEVLNNFFFNGMDIFSTSYLQKYDTDVLQGAECKVVLTYNKCSRHIPQLTQNEPQTLM